MKALLLEPVLDQKLNYRAASFTRCSPFLLFIIIYGANDE